MGFTMIIPWSGEQAEVGLLLTHVRLTPKFDETINWETMKSNNTIQGDACLVNMHVALQHEAMSSITRFEENKHCEWHWWVVEPRSDFHQLCRNDCNYFLLWKEAYYFRLLKVNDALLNTKLSLELFEPLVC